MLYGRSDDIQYKLLDPKYENAFDDIQSFERPYQILKSFLLLGGENDKNRCEILICTNCLSLKFKLI